MGERTLSSCLCSSFALLALDGDDQPAHAQGQQQAEGNRRGGLGDWCHRVSFNFCSEAWDAPTVTWGV